MERFSSAASRLLRQCGTSTIVKSAADPSRLLGDKPLYHTRERHTHTHTHVIILIPAAAAEHAHMCTHTHKITRKQTNTIIVHGIMGRRRRFGTQFV